MTEELHFPIDTPPDQGETIEVADGILWLRLPLATWAHTPRTAGDWLPVLFKRKLGEAVLHLNYLQG